MHVALNVSASITPVVEVVVAGEIAAFWNQTWTLKKDSGSK